MRVYCYHESVTQMDQSAQLDLLKLWEESWKRHGWEPVILNRSNCLNYPTFETYLNRVSAFPTVNPKQYEVACFLRWCAMANIGGGCHTDYDVINYGFTPEMCMKESSADTLTFFERHVPSVVYGTGQQYKDMMTLFQNYNQVSEDHINGRPHVSDMTIVNRFWGGNIFTHKFICKALDDDGWDDAPLVHFCASKVGSMTKAARVRLVGGFNRFGKKKSEISIILPFYRRIDLFQHGVGHNHGFLAKPDREVIVVMDDPRELKEVESLLKANKEIRWKLMVNRKEHEWRNPARAINVGIRQATGRNVFVASPETIFVGDTPGMLMAARKAFPRCCPVVSTYPMSAEFFHQVEGPAEWALARAQVLGYPCNIGGGIMIPLSVLHELTGYDERYSQWGREDAEMRQRLALFGMPAKQFPSAAVIHPAHPAPRAPLHEWMEEILQNVNSTRWAKDDEWGRDFKEMVLNTAN